MKFCIRVSEYLSIHLSPNQKINYNQVVYVHTKFKIKLMLMFNTIGQSSFISFATRMARPLLKLKHFILLVNVQLVKRLFPCNEQQIQHYLALLWK